MIQALTAFLLVFPVAAAAPASPATGDQTCFEQAVASSASAWIYPTKEGTL
jgi:hypothetical protein